ncbi:hypothetical protein DNTS_026341 [Danionella cerebrum]|uniref:Neurotransmitter-gated ion-channel ligand-binding domain-containing protein n=1 Tax=Danionella cerebrum TaxID=2873325 RepID=A0A553QWK7_9TELE|nr:hypothetical protein DNTS_026341 [Danionella translucida]
MLPQQTNPGAQAWAMNSALAALRLMCLASLMPVTQLKGSNTQNQRRHKDVYLNENTRHKHGGRIDFKMKKSDSTKSLLIKSEQLLRIEDHDFAIRPGFGGSAIPVGIDVQVESIDSISEVNMDFTMTLYLRHYWQDDRLGFPSSNNKSRTFDARLVKKIWVPDVFFVHSKRSFIHDTTMENIMLRVYPDGNILYSVRLTKQRTLGNGCVHGHLLGSWHRPVPCAEVIDSCFPRGIWSYCRFSSETSGGPLSFCDVYSCFSVVVTSAEPLVLRPVARSILTTAVARRTSSLYSSLLGTSVVTALQQPVVCPVVAHRFPGPPSHRRSLDAQLYSGTQALSPRELLTMRAAPTAGNLPGPPLHKDLGGWGGFFASAAPLAAPLLPSPVWSSGITVTALCSMDFSRFPLDSQNCSLELESCEYHQRLHAYNENDLMLYWKNGNDSLRTDEIALSQFFIEEFHPSYGLAFYSSTGWYNRLYINFILRRHIFFFMLQTYFPTMLMVMLSWVSFWIDRRAVPARVSLAQVVGGLTATCLSLSLHGAGPGIGQKGKKETQVGLQGLAQEDDGDGPCSPSGRVEIADREEVGITTVLTMSTIITGVSASMPQVSYVKAVDIYLWASFLFVFLSVIEYAAVNYFTTVEEMKKLRKGKLPVSYDPTQAMAYDGCFHDDIDVASPFPDMPNTPSTTHNIPTRASPTDPQPPTEGTRLWRKRSVGKNIRFIMSNSYMIDSYSRILFPMAYLLFNIIYWCIYS